MAIKQITKTDIVSNDVRVEQTIDVIDGEYLDTHVKLSGTFAISGSQREEFLKKLGSLIDDHRI